MVPLSVARARLVRCEAEGNGAPICFLGDLDPLDLTHYLTLRAGGVGSAPTALDVTYLGVGDALIALCEAHVRSRVRPLFEQVTITMTDFERRHLAALEAVWPVMASVVGPRSMALLRAGRKLELEGAINPAIYDDAFPEALLAFVCGGAPTG